MINLELIVGITGATGIQYGIRLLEVLQKTPHKTHLIVSPWGKKNIEIETTYKPEEVIRMADYFHDYQNLAANISSGSYPIDGMVVVPCSMKSLSAMATGFTDNLLNRAVDVALKEKRKLVLVPRETPLHEIHLENMLKLSRAGAILLPPMPAFYHNPQSISAIVDQTVGKILDQFGIEHQLFQRWEGKNLGNC